MTATQRAQYQQRRRDRVLAAAAARGIRVEPLGSGWRLVGPGVDLVCADLAALSPEVLKPQRRR